MERVSSTCSILCTPLTSMPGRAHKKGTAGQDGENGGPYGILRYR